MIASVTNRNTYLKGVVVVCGRWIRLLGVTKMDNIKLYSVILDPSIKNYRYLLRDIVSETTDDSGNSVCHFTCTEVDTSGGYLSAIVSSESGGITRPIQLNHSFVVAVLELVNQQNKPGFVR